MDARSGALCGLDISLKLTAICIVEQAGRAPSAQGLGDPVGRLAGSKRSGPMTFSLPQQERLRTIRSCPRLCVATINDLAQWHDGARFRKMPKSSTFQNQSLWGEIGWAAPAYPFEGPNGALSLADLFDGQHQPRAVFRHAPGLNPTRRVNTRERWLWSAKPHARAILDSDASRLCSRALAASTRA
jgi:hypothetical protein